MGQATREIPGGQGEESVRIGVRSNRDKIAMQLNRLWVFYHVARHKSFSRAAEALFLSQPSVSSQVKLLEEACGLKLFDRFGRGSGLTNAGEVLYAYAERIFDLVKEADGAIEELRGADAGTIRISASNTLCAYYLPDVIDRFRRGHPRVEIQMDAGYTENVVDSILKFKSDLGLVGRAIADPNIVTLPLWEEELVLIVPPGHPFAAGDTIDTSEIKDQPFIMSETGSGVRAITEEIFLRAGLSPRVVMELGENEAVKRAVAAGLGIAIISARVAKRELEAGSLLAVRLAGQKMLRIFHMIHHKDKHLSPLVRAFMAEALRFPIPGGGPAPEGRSR